MICDSHLPIPTPQKEKQKQERGKRARKEMEGVTDFLLYKYLQLLFYFQIFQVNVVSYKTRPNAKDFIQVEILVEKNSQKIILIGRVCHLYQNSVYYL